MLYAVIMGSVYSTLTGSDRVIVRNKEMSLWSGRPPTDDVGSGILSLVGRWRRITRFDVFCIKRMGRKADTHIKSSTYAAQRQQLPDDNVGSNHGSVVAWLATTEAHAEPVKPTGICNSVSGTAIGRHARGLTYVQNA